MSGLGLATAEHMLKGGKRGAAVVPGDAEGSLLYQAVAGKGELKMPPGRPALSTEELATIKQWIQDGAKWDVEGGAGGFVVVAEETAASAGSDCKGCELGKESDRRFRFEQTGRKGCGRLLRRIRSRWYGACTST